MRSFHQVWLTVFTTFAVVVPAMAQPGLGRGHGKDALHNEDHEVFHYLLSNHDKIKRTVKMLPNGVETLTESDDEKVASKIKEHVRWMQHRVEEVKPIRMRDPLFAELFRHAKNIEIKREETKKGVRVRETSDDPFTVKLIQAHAKTVSGFVKDGFKETMKNHPVPNKKISTPAFINPAIDKYGKVVKLPEAKQQPRDGAKIVVDLLAGGSPDKLNPSIEKVARFVNIYRGAGREPAKVNIAIVLHGETTLSVLNADAYARKFGTDGNPNLDCLHELHKAGVKMYVCGQSLISKGAKPEEVAIFVDVSVSALTSTVNLQQDGFMYIPLAK